MYIGRTENTTMSRGRKLAKNRCRSSYEEESENGLDRHSGDLMTVLTRKHYSGHHKAAEAEDDPGTLGEEIWRRKCFQQSSGTAGGRWRQWLKTELDRVKWSVVCDPAGLTRHTSKSSFRVKDNVVTLGIWLGLIAKQCSIMYSIATLCG